MTTTNTPAPIEEEIAAIRADLVKIQARILSDLAQRFGDVENVPNDHQLARILDGVAGIIRDIDAL